MKTNPGCARLDGAGSPSASSRRPAAAPPRSPQVRSKTSFIISIAMSQRTPSHWSAIEPSVSIDRAAQVGRERVQLDDVRPGREVRVAAVREHAAADARRTTPGRARGRRRCRGRSTPGASAVHGWSGATWFGTKSRISPSAALARAPRAPRRARPARRGARRPRSRGCSTASRRRPRSRSRAARAGSSRRAPSFSSAIAIPAGLRSQTPISQTASKPSAAIASHSRAGHLARPTVAPVPPAQLVEPDPGVDLVDEGVLDQRLRQYWTMKQAALPGFVSAQPGRARLKRQLNAERGTRCRIPTRPRGGSRKPPAT